MATLIAACATMGGIAMTITAASIALAGVQSELQLGIDQLQWVLNSFINPPPLNGEAMYICAVAGSAVAEGICFVPCSKDASALIMGRGVPRSSAAVASAPNSRVREMASWIIVAVIGAKIRSSSPTSGLCSRSSPIGMK